MSEELVIRHCAPTLASIKTGSLFPCPCTDRAQLTAFARDLNHRLARKSLQALPLHTKKGTYLLYVYRPQRLAVDLHRREARRLLRSCGYSGQSIYHDLKTLVTRFAESEEFPHEIGLFLSYPPEDVTGFIYHKDQAKYTGCWKVYGDVESARRTFARYKKCSALYQQLWNRGYAMEQLAV